VKLRNKAMQATDAADVTWRRDFIEPPCFLGAQAEIRERPGTTRRSSLCECGPRRIPQNREGFDSYESALKFGEQLGSIFTFEKERCGETLRDTECSG